MRRFHRWLGVGAALFLLLAAATGLLWAYAPHLYWEGGYLARKHPPAAFDFSAITLTHQGAIRAARQRMAADLPITEVTLRAEVDVPFFEINTGESSVLIDARNGEVLSPLSEELATRIAAQYVRGQPGVESAALLDRFVHRSRKVHHSVYRVQFRAPKNPVIYLSALTGAIIEEEDDVRRFHFWIMRLHQLNFFGFHKTLTIIPGGALLLLIITGLVLSRRAKNRA